MKGDINRFTLIDYNREINWFVTYGKHVITFTHWPLFSCLSNGQLVTTHKLYNKLSDYEATYGSLIIIIVLLYRIAGCVVPGSHDYYQWVVI